MMKYKDGIEAQYGDVIRWQYWDSDDLHTWTFTGLYTPRGVVYLGGGLDFGMAIGNIETVEDVIEESENNDPDDCGIVCVGKYNELNNLISNFIAI